MDLDLFGVFDGKQRNSTEDEQQQKLSSTLDGDEKPGNANSVSKGPSDEEPPQREKFVPLEERALGKRTREEVGSPVCGLWCWIDVLELVLVV